MPLKTTKISLHLPEDGYSLCLGDEFGKCLWAADVSVFPFERNVTFTHDIQTVIMVTWSSCPCCSAHMPIEIKDVGRYTKGGTWTITLTE